MTHAGAPIAHDINTLPKVHPAVEEFTSQRNQIFATCRSRLW